MPSNLKLICAVSLFASLTGFSTYSLAGELSNRSNKVENSTTIAIPQQLQLSSSQALLYHTSAKGVQIYTCQPKENDSQKFSWKLKAPEATLYVSIGGNKQVAIGKHYAGPTWEHKDGSKIQGKIKAKVDAPVANAIPWLLLDVTSHEGQGTFGKIDYVQRIGTNGGQAPAKGCDPTKKNAEVRVDYTADYYFFGNAPAPKK
jgi:hypothetical protein